MSTLHCGASAEYRFSYRYSFEPLFTGKIKPRVGPVPVRLPAMGSCPSSPQLPNQGDAVLRQPEQPWRSSVSPPATALTRQHHSASALVDHRPLAGAALSAAYHFRSRSSGLAGNSKCTEPLHLPRLLRQQSLPAASSPLHSPVGGDPGDMTVGFRSHSLYGCSPWSPAKRTRIHPDSPQNAMPAPVSVLRSPSRGVKTKRARKSKSKLSESAADVQSNGVPAETKQRIRPSDLLNIPFDDSEIEFLDEGVEEEDPWEISSCTLMGDGEEEEVQWGEEEEV